jgi:hypothetical protein
VSRNVLSCLIKFLRRPGVPPARTSGLFWADHGLLFPNLVKEGLPTIRELSRGARIEMLSAATSTGSPP